MTKLKLLIKDCEYPNSEEMVRDCVAFGTNSPSVRGKLLSQGAELTLEKAIDIARSHEISQQQLKLINQRKDSSSNDTVNAVGRNSYKRQNIQAPKQRENSSAAASHASACHFCAGQHGPKDPCPAKGTQCLKCRKYNHYAAVCKSSKAKAKHSTVHAV